MKLWDPLNAWPKGRRWLWAVLAGFVCLTLGPKFLQDLRPERERWTDFFQEWASARNYRCGLPIYADHRLAIERHLGYVGEGEWPNLHKGASFITVNAHPPTAVLLALPLGFLDYPDAVLVWNLLSLAALLLSLWLVARALSIPVSRWSVAPLIALLLLCTPFLAQMFYGQLNLVLLLVLTGIWIAHRSGRPMWAGALLGLAVAIKLFPAFLFVYFLLQRQWKTVSVGILSLLVVTALTAAVLGTDTYRIYALEVIPKVALFRGSWLNASIPGFWTKLCHPQNSCTEPLYGSVAMARTGTWLSCGVVVAVLARLLVRDRERAEKDRSFALTLTAMLLVSPVTWNHYALLLLVPLAVAWTRLPAANLARMTFLAVVFILWLRPEAVYDTFILRGAKSGIATSWQTLCILSLPCYALLGLFALLAGLPPQSRGRIEVVEERDSSTPTADLVSRAALHPCSS
jgi:hypothetical protein